MVQAATDQLALDLVDGIAGVEFARNDFSYKSTILIEREFIEICISYLDKEVMKSSYFYSLEGWEDGSVKVSLVDSVGDEVLSITFESDYDFNKLAKYS